MVACSLAWFVGTVIGVVLGLGGLAALGVYPFDRRRRAWWRG